MVPNKPDIVAPNGVNTSVNFGSIDYDQDGIPNFFGTSAAAPHVAGAAALMLEAKQHFYFQAMSPAEAKAVLLGTSVDMNTPGFDYTTGYGFINADSALRTFANPKPFIRNLQLAGSSILPGSQPSGLIVNGNYFTSTTQIILGTDTLATTVLSSTVATATLPLFNGNRFVTLYTPPKSPSGLDGGLSNSVAINGIVKRNISVIANNKTKKYAAQFPPFTVTVLVDGDSLQNTTLTLAGVGLTNISYQTPATATSNVGIYFIRPLRVFDSANAADRLLSNRFNYTFIDGALVIEKLAVSIVPRDTTLVYGERPVDFGFNYSYDPGVTIADPAALISSIKSDHQNQLEDNTVGLVNGQAVTIVNGRAVPIVNGQAVTIVNGQAVTIVNGRAVPIVNSQAITIVNGQAVPIVNNLTAAQTQNLSFLATTPSLLNARQITNKTLINGAYATQTTKVVDITQESILKYNVNSAQTSMVSSVSNVNGRGLIDVTSLTSGQAITIVNGQAVTIVNGQAVTIVNGQAVTIVNGQAVTIVNGQAVPIVNGQNRTAVIVNSEDIGNGLNQLKSINIITGISAGVHTIIPGSLLNDNLAITYGTGTLTILPAPLTVKAKNAVKSFGTSLKLDSTAFTIASGVLQYGEAIQSVSLTSTGTTAAAPAGTYPIIPSNAVGRAGTNIGNYSITYGNGVLTVLNNGFTAAPPPSNKLINIDSSESSASIKINIHPNPARGRAIITVPGKPISAKGLLLFDAYGKSYPVKVVRQASSNAIEIDVSRLVSGYIFYTVKG